MIALRCECIQKNRKSRRLGFFYLTIIKFNSHGILACACPSCKSIQIIELAPTNVKKILCCNKRSFKTRLTETHVITECLLCEKKKKFKRTGYKASD